MRRLILLAIVLAASSVCHGQMVFYEPNDTTDVSVFFYSRDDTTGDPNTSPVLTDYTFYYCKLGSAAASGVALTALATAATAHTDNYGYHVGGGLIRVDVPDAAFAGDPGDKIACWMVDGTGDDQIEPVYIQLNPPVNVMTLEGDVVSDSADVAAAVLDVQTSSHATAGTVGKAVADSKTAAEATQTDWANGGRLDLILDGAYALADKIIKMIRY